MIFPITNLLDELKNIIKTRLNYEDIACLIRAASKDGNDDVDCVIEKTSLEALKNFNGMSAKKIANFVKMSTNAGAVENWEIIADCIEWNKLNAREIYRLAKATKATRESLDEFSSYNVEMVCKAAINSGSLNEKEIADLVKLMGNVDREWKILEAAKKSGKLDTDRKTS